MSKLFQLARFDQEESWVAMLNEKDMKYLIKLIHYDVNYRTSRDADRAWSGSTKAITKANELRDLLITILNEEGDEIPTGDSGQAGRKDAVAGGRLRRTG